MRRRKLFTLAAGVSAVLCVGVCVLWVRSYWVSDNWVRDVPAGRIGMGSERGRIVWRHVSYLRGTRVVFNAPVGYQTVPVTATGVGSSPTPASWSFARSRMFFEHAVGRPPAVSGLVDVEDFAVPLWAPVLTASVLPAIWLLLRMAGRMRAAAGLCPACGYDLRATPDRCPECGRMAG
jgi:hypothetical protein